MGLQEDDCNMHNMYDTFVLYIVSHLYIQLIHSQILLQSYAMDGIALYRLTYNTLNIIYIVNIVLMVHLKFDQTDAITRDIIIYIILYWPVMVYFKYSAVHRIFQGALFSWFSENNKKMLIQRGFKLSLRKKNECELIAPKCCREIPSCVN